MRLFVICSLILTALVIIGCRHKNVAANAPPASINLTEKKPLRVGMVTGIKPEKIAYYKELHANAWKGVLKKIEECNIRNFSIYLKKIDDKYYLFSYYDYVGDNYEQDMKKIAADTITQRWWRETDPCQLPLPEAAAAGKIWTPMEEVFHAE